MAKATEKVNRIEMIGLFSKVMRMVDEIRWGEENKNYAELDKKLFDAYMALNRAILAECKENSKKMEQSRKALRKETDK